MPIAAADSIVDTSSTPIAVRDFGGDGVGIILIHGLSRTLADWNVMGPMLANDHHVVAMDIRGHGKSADGPWSWTAAVEDVGAVANHFGMTSPAVVGHSLGGMIASMWGRDHAESAGVINLDGHGNPRTDQYVGLDPGWVAEKRLQLDALQKQQLAALSGPLSEAGVEALITQQKGVAARVGAPEDLFVEGLKRMLEVRDGGTYLRPAVDGLGAEIYASLDDVDMFAVYRDIRCPLLLVNAVEPPGGSTGGPPWIADLISAFRNGQTRDLRALEASQANVRLETVRGTHGLLFEQVEPIAEMVLEFL
jgi:pimeloyl-ACP methyl ester carboxylesterase